MHDLGDWFRDFVDNFAQSSVIGAAYRRYEAGARETSTDWTRVMNVFLADVADKHGLYQEVERCCDFSWYKPHTLVPQVGIEHENDYRTIYENEIPTLLASSAETKVLITYVNRASATLEDTKNLAREVAAKVSGILQEGGGFRGGFLLIVGLGEVDNKRDWIGFGIDARGAIQEFLP